MEWIDAHQHSQEARLKPWRASMLQAQVKEGIIAWAVNSVSEADWEDVAQMAVEFPEVIPQFGIHPWCCDQLESAWEERLQNLLERFPRAGVGECGLDFSKKSVPADTQVEVFIRQLQLAREMDRTLTIHTVNAWEALFGCFEKVSLPRRVLLHGFAGSLEIAQRLQRYDVYFSFSGKLLHANQMKRREVFRHLPLDRIVLETDAPHQLPPAAHRNIQYENDNWQSEWNHPANLSAIGDGLAGWLGISTEACASITTSNARRLFSMQANALK